MGTTSFSGTAVTAMPLPSARVVVTQHTPASLVPRHRHDSAFVTYVVQGTYVERVGREHRVCERGALVLHPRGEEHEDRFGESASTLVSAELDPAHAIARIIESSGGAPVIATNRLAAIGRTLIDELTLFDTATPLAVESLLLETAALITRERTRLSQAVPSWLARVDEIIAGRFRERVSLSSIATELRLDPSYLARAYRQHRGTTIGATLRSFRLQAARASLSSREPLAAIALDCGFADQSHLTRAFRAAFGVTPARYRSRSMSRNRTAPATVQR